MSLTKARICRLCLSIFNEDIHLINKLQIEMLHIILPELDLNLSEFVFICSNCITNLEKTFSFKSDFLEIEDNIHGYRVDLQDQIDLEKIIGISGTAHGTSTTGKICRTCLQLIEDDSFEDLCDENNPLTNLLRTRLPEMDINLTKNPVVCCECRIILEKNFNFVSLCLKAEEKIKAYLEVSNQNDSIDLYDVVQYMWSRDVQNTQCFDNTEVDINVKDEDITQSTMINNASAQFNKSMSVSLSNNELNSKKSNENDIYLISDDDESNKSSTTNIKTNEKTAEHPTMNVYRKVVNIKSVELSNNCNISSDEQRRGSYLTAVETMKTRATDFETISDTESVYSIELVSRDESDVSDIDLNDNKKRVTHNRKRRRRNLLAPEARRVTEVDCNIVSNNSIHSIESASNNEDDNSIHSSKHNGATQARRAKTITETEQPGSSIDLYCNLCEKPYTGSVIRHTLTCSYLPAYKAAISKDYMSMNASKNKSCRNTENIRNVRKETEDKRKPVKNVNVPPAIVQQIPSAPVVYIVILGGDGSPVPTTITDGLLTALSANNASILEVQGFPTQNVKPADINQPVQLPTNVFKVMPEPQTCGRVDCEPIGKAQQPEIQEKTLSQEQPALTNIELVRQTLSSEKVNKGMQMLQTDMRIRNDQPPIEIPNMESNMQPLSQTNELVRNSQPLTQLHELSDPSRPTNIPTGQKQIPTVMAELAPHTPSKMVQETCLQPSIKTFKKSSQLEPTVNTNNVSNRYQSLVETHKTSNHKLPLRICKDNQQPKDISSSLQNQPLRMNNEVSESALNVHKPTLNETQFNLTTNNKLVQKRQSLLQLPEIMKNPESSIKITDLTVKCQTQATMSDLDVLLKETRESVEKNSAPIDVREISYLEALLTDSNQLILDVHKKSFNSGLIKQNRSRINEYETISLQEPSTLTKENRPNNFEITSCTELPLRNKRKITERDQPQLGVGKTTSSTTTKPLFKTSDALTVSNQYQSLVETHKTSNHKLPLRVCKDNQQPKDISSSLQNPPLRMNNEVSESVLNVDKPTLNETQLNLTTNNKLVQKRESLLQLPEIMKNPESSIKITDLTVKCQTQATMSDLDVLLKETRESVEKNSAPIDVREISYLEALLSDSNELILDVHKKSFNSGLIKQNRPRINEYETISLQEPPTLTKENQPNNFEITSCTELPLRNKRKITERDQPQLGVGKTTSSTTTKPLFKTSDALTMSNRYQSLVETHKTSNHKLPLRVCKDNQQPKDISSSLQNPPLRMNNEVSEAALNVHKPTLNELLRTNCSLTEKSYHPLTSKLVPQLRTNRDLIEKVPENIDKIAPMSEPLRSNFKPPHKNQPLSNLPNTINILESLLISSNMNQSLSEVLEIASVGCESKLKTNSNSNILEYEKNTLTDKNQQLEVLETQLNLTTNNKLVQKRQSLLQLPEIMKNPESLIKITDLTVKCQTQATMSDIDVLLKETRESVEKNSAPINVREISYLEALLTDSNELILDVHKKSFNSGLIKQNRPRTNEYETISRQEPPTLTKENRPNNFEITSCTELPLRNKRKITERDQPQLGVGKTTSSTTTKPLFKTSDALTVRNEPPVNVLKTTFNSASMEWYRSQMNVYYERTSVPEPSTVISNKPIEKHQPLIHSPNMFDVHRTNNKLTTESQPNKFENTSSSRLPLRSNNGITTTKRPRLNMGKMAPNTTPELNTSNQVTMNNEPLDVLNTIFHLNSTNNKATKKDQTKVKAHRMTCSQELQFDINNEPTTRNKRLLNVYQTSNLNLTNNEFLRTQPPVKTHMMVPHLQPGVPNDERSFSHVLPNMPTFEWFMCCYCEYNTRWYERIIMHTQPICPKMNVFHLNGQQWRKFHVIYYCLKCVSPFNSNYALQCHYCQCVNRDKPNLTFTKIYSTYYCLMCSFESNDENIATIHNANNLCRRL